MLLVRHHSCVTVHRFVGKTTFRTELENDELHPQSLLKWSYYWTIYLEHVLCHYGL